MRPQAFTEREFYRRRPVVSELPVTLALLVAAVVSVLVGMQPLLTGIERTGVELAVVTSIPLSIVASQFVYGVGLAVVALGYIYARDLDVTVAAPTRADLGPLTVAVLVPPLLVAPLAAVTPLLGAQTFADVSGTWYAPDLSLSWVVKAALPNAVFVPVGAALLYHGAAQGTFHEITDPDRAIGVTTALVGLFVLVADDPVFFVGSLGGVAEAVGLGVTVVVVGVAAWAYDRTESLVAPALAYAVFLFAVELATYLTAGPVP